MISANVSLAELGMDSIMAVEIKQTLERDFDILLTAQDLRTLNVAKLKKMTNKEEQTHDDAEVDTNDFNGLKLLIPKVKDSDLIPNIYVELITKKEDENEIFFIPGIEGSASIYRLIESKIKSSAICLQHGLFNMSNVSRSIIKSAAHLLPV